MKNVDELLEIARPMLTEAWADGKYGVEMDFSDPDAMLAEYADFYRREYGREPTTQTMQVARIMNGWLATMYAAGVAARGGGRS